MAVAAPRLVVWDYTPLLLPSCSITVMTLLSTSNVIAQIVTARRTN
jgi:hypothetical protein